jgi:hypothetical protein
MPLPPVTLQSAQLSIPERWTEAERRDDLLIFRGSNDGQKAFISILRFGADPSFDDFKRLCQHRIEAEKKVLGGGYIEPDEPFQTPKHFGMFYSGADRQTGRVFSGYLFLAHRELLTIYVESIGVAPADHFSSFRTWVEGLHEN